MTSFKRGPVTVRVPGSASNLGAGFDCVGLAVNRWLTATARFEGDTHSPRRVVRGGMLAAVAAPPENDLLVVGFRAACRAARHEMPAGLVIDARSEIPVARGLGSSAAAVVAGAALANELLGLGADVFRLAAIGSAVEGHPDNVCPALFGGATLALEHAGRFIVTPLDVSPRIAFAFAIPELVLETQRARAALPDVVRHVTAVQAAAKAAALVRGLATADASLLAAALDDVLHVPYRQALVRGYEEVVAAARGAGAFGATLSGSGPTIVAVAERERADPVAAAMIDAWRALDVVAKPLISVERVPGLALSPAATVG